MQHVVEETRVAYLNRDFQNFSRFCDIPQVVGSFEGDRTITKMSQMQVIVDKMCEFFDRSEVVDLHRSLLVAEFRGPDAVEATFVYKYLLQSGQLSEETYAHGVLRRVGDMWKISESRYASRYQAIENALHARGADDPETSAP